MKTVLITGATGDVGTHLRRELAGKYLLRLSDKRPLKPAKGEKFMRADISKMADALRITKGVDAIVHLGGYSVEGPWDGILKANIVGCYNVFEAARRNGVKRILFPTSNHAVGFYRRDQTIDHRVYPKPDSRYGVSKVFGEALGSLYADKYGMEVFMMRIGNVNERPIDKRRLSIWFSPRDLAQLVTLGIEHPAIRFEIVYGVSGNQRSWYDNSNAARLGYRPLDDSEAYAEEVLAREKPSSARIYTGFPYRDYGNNWFDGRVDHLMIMDAGGGEPRAVFGNMLLVREPGWSGVMEYDWRPGANAIVFSASVDFHQQADRFDTKDLYLLDLSGSAPRVDLLVDAQTNDRQPVFSPDGRYLAWHAVWCCWGDLGTDDDQAPAQDYPRSFDPRDSYRDNRILVRDMQSGVTTVLMKGWDRPPDAPVWSADGRELFFSAPDDGHYRVFRIALADALKGGRPAVLAEFRGGSLNADQAALATISQLTLLVAATPATVRAP